MEKEGAAGEKAGPRCRCARGTEEKRSGWREMDQGEMDNERGHGWISEKNLTSCRQPDLDATISSRPPAAPVPKIHQPQYINEISIASSGLQAGQHSQAIFTDIKTGIAHSSLSYRRI